MNSFTGISRQFTFRNLRSLGRVPTISTKRLYGHAVPLPPLAEQRAIAAYLDRETAQIDTLITKTEQLNALLREKRVALISHTVTKGLDPAAPLKDSGRRVAGRDSSALGSSSH